MTPTYLIVDSYRGTRYNIIRIGQAFYGVSQSEGSVDSAYIERGQFIEKLFSSDNFFAITVEMDNDPTIFRIPGLSHNLLEENYRNSRYSVIEYAGEYFAVTEDDIPFDIGDIKTNRNKGNVYKGNSRNEVEKLINHDPWAWSDRIPFQFLRENAETAPSDSVLLANCHIDLKNASVIVPTQSHDTLKSLALRGFRSRPVAPISLLRDISVRIAPNERVGVIGLNGAGKTTLLKAIAGIYPLSTGSRSVKGLIAPIIGQSIGFDRVFSVERNIKLSIAHMGFLNRYSDEMLYSIAEFAELSHRLSAPVQTLSSGQIAKLSFSITMHLESDILILDEIFSTGDLVFVDRSIERISRKIYQTPIVVFVSHDLTAIQRFCTRCIIMAEGRIICDGSTDTIIGEYIKMYGSTHSIPR